MAGKRKKILQTIREQDGTYQYVGDHFRVSDNNKNGRKQLMKVMVFFLPTLAVVILSGCINAAGASEAFYVILPYVGEVSALFLLGWNVVRLFANSSRMRSYVLDQVRSRIPGACTVLCGFALLGLVMAVVFLMKNGSGGKTAESALYLFCKALAALLALGCRKAFAGLEWEKTEN